MPYQDLIYEVSGNATQGDAVAKSTGMHNYVAITRGLPVNYSGWANTFSGKFRTQIYVISGSGL